MTKYIPTTPIPTYMQVENVKYFLRELLAKIEAAEAEAADTKWLDEKESILNAVMSEVASRCDHFAYESTH